MRCAFACSSLLTIPARTMAGPVRFGAVDGPDGGFRKDASQSSLATGSGDSADGAANEVSSSAVAEMLPAPVVAEGGWPKGAGGRPVQSEYLKRGDVGALALLTGNWGGHRKDKTRQSHVDEDLKKNPASLLCLQEAQAELVGLLAAPAVAGDAGAEDALQRRTGYQYHCVRMDEHEKTLLIAVRVNICERLAILESVRRVDGRYKEKNDTKGHMPVMKTAITRILVGQVDLRVSMAGHERLVVANVHLHRYTAKKFHGFAASFDRFWDELSALVLKHQVRILAGDFNMSLWEVVPQLRRRRIQVQMAAWFPWYDNMGQVKGDSCGIFLIGEAAAIKPLHGPSVFTAAVADQETTMDSWLNLPKFTQGQGYALASYLPKGSQIRAAQASLQASSVEEGPFATEGWNPLPPCKQKRIVREMFDPDGLLFRSGAHMPLIIFLGAKARRSPEALVKREEAAISRGWGPPSKGSKGKGKEETKGKGKVEKGQGKEDKGKGKGGKGKGQTKGGEAGKGQRLAYTYPWWWGHQ